MKDIFSTDGMAALRRFAAPDTLLGLDYDGTLVPIVADPAEANLSPDTHARLQHVTARYPTVVITGRAVADARQLLAGLPIEVIGNHGAEGASLIARALEGRVAAWREHIAQHLSLTPGISIEDKRYSLAIHYRRSPDWAAAQSAVLRAVGGLPGARIVPGKAVVNVLLHEAPDKGAALLVACARARCRRAIYIGDDETDEDVFALDRPDQVLGICVGRKPGSRAAFCLESQELMNDLFDALLSASDALRIPPRLDG